MRAGLLSCFLLLIGGAAVAACSASGDDDGTGSGSTSAATGGTGSGGSGGAGAGGEGGAGSGGSAPAGAGGSGASGSGGTGSGGGGGDGGRGGGATTGGGGGNPSPIVPVLDLTDLYANCQLPVSPDPLLGGFVATYENPADGAPSTADIVGVRVIYGAGMDTSFEVAPTSSGIVQPGQSLTVAHAKETGTAFGSPPCDHCNDSWTLEVRWMIAGELVIRTLGPQVGNCVF